MDIHKACVGASKEVPCNFTKEKKEKSRKEVFVRLGPCQPYQLVEVGQEEEKRSFRRTMCAVRSSSRGLQF